MAIQCRDVFLGTDATGMSAAGIAAESILVVGVTNPTIKDNLMVNGAFALDFVLGGIQNNKIGTNKTGTQDVSNLGSFAEMNITQSTGTLVGGPVIGKEISGNTGPGLTIHTSTNVSVEGNLIGTTLDCAKWNSGNLFSKLYYRRRYCRGKKILFLRI